MKKNKFEFIIDSEFQSQIPALTDEEFQQLEENILSEGEVLRIWAKRQKTEQKSTPGIPDYTFKEGESL